MIYRIKILLIVILISFSIADSQISKKGGIYFRVDDNQPINKWRDYAKIMDKHGIKFGFALNLGLLKEDKEYYQLIKDLQSSGHELQDHTPDHQTMFFTHPQASKFELYPGVDHINNDKVCLKLSPINTDKVYNGEGHAEISGNIVISQNPGGFKLFNTTILYSKIYFPEINLLCGFSKVDAKNEFDVDTLYITSAWGEDIFLPTKKNTRFEILTSFEIDITDEGIQLLAERTIELSDKNNIKRPQVWIQPGGLHSVLKRSQVKRIFGNKYGYTSAGVAQDPVKKGYNVYNVFDDDQFGMDWGDFQEYGTYFSTLQSTIADKIAKHYVLGGSNHFKDLLGNWDDYLIRLDSLLNWCKKNDILVKTQSEWAQTLFKTPLNIFENIIPRLYVDLDNNKRPDGYYFQKGYTLGELDTIDGVDIDKRNSFSISKPGVICEISELTGIEKGELDFRIWTKGSSGNNILVRFSFPENNESYTFSFPTDNSTWKKYSLDQSNNGNTKLIIPDSISLVNIVVICPTIKNGPIKISGMELGKKIENKVQILSAPLKRVDLGKRYEYQVVCYSQNQSSKTTVSSDSLPSWLSLHNNTLVGIAPSENGVYSVSLIATNSKEEDADTQSYFINVEKISRLSINTKGIDLGGLGSNVPKDTTLLFANIGEDTLMISSYEISSSTLECSIPKLFPPGKVEYIPIRISPSKAGVFSEKIYIYSNGNAQPEDTIEVLGFVDSINNYGGIFGTPADFSLSQNFPNPFNAGTVINYSIKTDSRVSIVIYNVLGQTVNVLESSRPKSPGYYQVKWKGDGTNGSSLGSGVYFYRMTAVPDDGSAQKEMFKKMLLIR